MKDIYNKAMAIYDDYRYYVPSFSSAALSFYLIILLIPATTIIAVVTSSLHVSVEILEMGIKEFIQPAYAEMLIDTLKGSSLNTVSVLVFIWSFYAVSRGVGNIYDISKKMFSIEERSESVIAWYIYVFKVTMLLLGTLLISIVLLATGPISRAFHFLYGIAFIRFVLLFVIMVLFFMAIYMIVPRERITYHEALQGAFVTSGGIVILYIALNYYFKYADLTSLYGPLSSICVILFVFDWASEIFYIGMYLTHIAYLRRNNAQWQEKILERVNQEEKVLTKTENLEGIAVKASTRGLIKAIRKKIEDQEKTSTRNQEEIQNQSLEGISTENQEKILTRNLEETLTENQEETLTQNQEKSLIRNQEENSIQNQEDQEKKEKK
ncbi:YhjD/YihY/BrkB family envelope integrity protein [uncultured Catenibacterium sp.]|uniref:YihY/virulence factor BrkB family protein n=1 Tax=uncultured Catenibacterium sp. TaxID=286142 RepID=UPI0025D0D9B4|nr:YhjD/YihY/BrkB family envelope integrity protein [uncultured Catenibacterium sp.]